VSQHRDGLRWLSTLLAAAGFLGLASVASAGEVEPPELIEAVNKGEILPVRQRLPDKPRVIDTSTRNKQPGQYGGTIKMLMADAQDIRLMTVYSYARLVGFDLDYSLVPDILESYSVEDERIFTLTLREGHKWSDGVPFTAEDFRYFWEDVATNPELFRAGPSQEMVVDGELPKFEVLDEHAVRFSWSKPNPLFLPSLAGARPNYIFVPAHYLRQFHKKYADPEELSKRVSDMNVRDWVALHTVMSRQYRPENPDLPTLDPWANTTAPPAERFVFRRNPYFHRVDQNGLQLPYISTIHMRISSGDIIAAKTGSGDSDLQARYLRFDDYTFLKRAEKTRPLRVDLWKEGTGSRLSLLPNLNVNDAVWRSLLRDVRMRRALSLAINRHEINQQFFFGLAHESADTVLPESPLFRPEYAEAYARHDPHAANALLDEIGLVRGPKGIRLLPDGRPAEIIVEYAGGREESDILELVREYWAEIGLKMYQRAVKRDNLRRRFLAGDTMMTAWNGLTVGLATADLPPEELAPVSSAQGQWPKWGEYLETGGRAGEPVDEPAAKQLQEHYMTWRHSASHAERERVWQEMLALHARQVFTIGTVNKVLQPVVRNAALENVPKDGIYAFSPTAYFGIYLPDTFWFSKEGAAE
jgi:peptide/nickel transport system substrate-binding protein